MLGDAAGAQQIAEERHGGRRVDTAEADDLAVAALAIDVLEQVGGAVIEAVPGDLAVLLQTSGDAAGSKAPAVISASPVSS